jgi:hypothetical protein
MKNSRRVEGQRYRHRALPANFRQRTAANIQLRSFSERIDIPFSCRLRCNRNVMVIQTLYNRRP